MDYRPKYRQLTPEDVLAALRESFRQQVEYDDMAALSRGTELSFETTVAKWRDACDLVNPLPLGRAMNASFEVQFSDAEWRSALTPEKKRTLRDVCDLLARQAKAPIIEEYCSLGARCRPAGAFMLIRDSLARAGANVEDLRPSTALAEPMRQYAHAVMLLAEKIAPGALPPVKFVNRAYDCGENAIGLGFAAIGLGALAGCCGFGLLTLAVPLGLIVCHFGEAWTNAAARKPDSVTFGELATFRELSFVLAREQPRGLHGLGAARQSKDCRSN